MSSASVEARRLAGSVWAAALLLALLCAAAIPALAQPTVTITGNRAISDSVLRAAAADELERLARLGGRRADADDAAFRMALAYRREGYASAEVSFRMPPQGEGAVEFTVREGPRVMLGDVVIEGAAAVSAARLREFFPSADPGLLRAGTPPAYVEEQIRAAVGAATDHYLERGYLDVTVAGPEVRFSEDRTRADVSIAITEGPQYRVRAAMFLGDLPEKAAGKLRDLKRSLEGALFTAPVELAVRGKVSGIYGDLGYPDVAVRVERKAGGAPGEVFLEVSIASGPRVRIASIEVTGTRRTRKGFVVRRVPLAPGDWYNLEKIQKAIRDLYATGIFSRVDVQLAEGGEAAEAAKERILIVDVDEAPARELSASVGWSAYEQIRLQAGFRHLNLFGRGRAAGIEGTLSTKRSSVTVDLTDPRLLAKPLEATLPVSYRRDEEPAFTKRQVQIAPQLSWQLSRTLAATASLPLEYSWTGSFSEETPAELAAENYRLARLAFQVRSDTRKGLFLPSRGLEATASSDFADMALGSELNFVRLVGKVRWYLPLARTTVLALRGETGIVVPTRGANDVPLSERFFLGGERSVRSFRESRLGPLDEAGEPVGGLGYNLLGIEVRQWIAGNLSGAAFADLGNISPNRSSASLVPNDSPTADRDTFEATRRDFLRDIRAGVGLGLRYLFPIGPVRLDVAWNPGRREGEDRYVANLSVGIPF